MKLTNEQNQIIKCKSNNIVVQALAGTGKTTTLIEFTKANKDQKFLYVAFNKSIVEEATQKFPANVTVKTVHSMAFQWFNLNYPDKFLSTFIPFAKMESFFKSKNIEINFPAVNRINNLLKLFYSSNLKKIEDTRTETGLEFSNGDIEKAKLILLDLKSKKGILNPTHDFYLKLYHLAEIQLTGYDYILFDESQDSNDVITAIVLQQNTKKIFVGDRHQAIYQFRGSRDALTGFEKQADNIFHLTETFRYGDNLAKIASSFLNNYKLESKTIKGLEKDTTIFIYDKIEDMKSGDEIIDYIKNVVLENKKNNLTTCFISYKNIGVLDIIEKIFEYNEENKLNKIKFKLNGDLNKYNFDMIKIIYELVKQEKQYSHDGKKSPKVDLIFKEKFTDVFESNSNNPFASKSQPNTFKTFIEKNSLKQLKDYFKDYKTTKEFCDHMEEQKKSAAGDDIYKAYKLAMRLVKYGKRDFIKDIESNQRNENSPDFILTTAHIAKGLEWDSVILSDDLFNVFFNKNKYSKFHKVDLNTMKNGLIKKLGVPFGGEFHQFQNWIKVEDEYNQEANLIYVSLTRAKKSIYIPEKLVNELNLIIEE